MVTTTVVESFLPGTGFHVAPMKASVCLVTSVPDDGDPEEGTGYHELWQGVTLIEKSKGLSYGFVVEDGLEYTIWSKFVARNGVAGEWVPTTVQATDSPTINRYLAVGSGSDAADGTSPANAWNSWAHALSTINSQHTNGTLSRLFVKRGSTSTETALWNKTTFDGILQIEPYDEGMVPEINYVDGTNLFIDDSPDGGLKIVDLNFVGDHVAGSVSGTGIPITRHAQSGGSGYRVTLLRVGFYDSPDAATNIDSSTAISEQPSGTFDDYCVAECTFDNTRVSALLGGTGARGLLYRDNRFLTSTGGSSGSMMRGAKWYGAYIARNEFDRTGSIFRANNLRIVGGSNTNASDTNTAVTVYMNEFLEATSGIQIDDPSGSATLYHHSVEIISNKVVLMSGAAGYCLGVNSAVSFSQDIGLLKSETNEYYQGGTNPCVNISMSGNVTTGKLHRFRQEKDTCFTETGTGVFSRSVIITRTQGHADNYDNDSQRYICNYGYSAETDGGSDPQCAYDFVDPVNKVEMEAGTVVAKNGTDLTFHQGDNLAAWISATGLGSESSLTASTSEHNLTSTTPATLDFRPASGSGLQVDKYTGSELRAWLDINLALMTATIEAGCGEWDATVFPDPPPPPVLPSSRVLLIT